MLSRVMLGFLGGVAVAGGVAWFMQARHEAPVAAQAPAPVAVVNEPAPEPAKAPEPKVETPPKPAVVAAAPRRAVTPVAKPAPVKAAEEEKPIVLPAPTPAEQPAYSLPLPAQPQPAATTTVAKADPKPEAKPEPKAPRTPHTVTIPAGTLITVRLNETLDSGRNEQDYNFRATLDTPLTIDNLILAERGSVQMGRVVGVEKASRARNTAQLQLSLTRLTTSDGQTVDIDTEVFTKKGERGLEKKEVAKRSAIGAVIGATIGAMAGGGKGAAIGAGAGAGAGAGSVVVQKGEEAVLTSETRISFRLKNPVTITEKLPN